MKSENFVDYLTERAFRIKSRLIVGLDPTIERFPGHLQAGLSWPLSDEDAEQVITEFNNAIIDATHDRVAAYKPQVAFYEQYGLGGLKALQNTVAYLRAKDCPVIMDAKRGDIESTGAAYAKAWLGQKLATGAENPFRADAITLNPYLGLDGIRPFLEASHNAGIFVLAKTSNPSSGDLQDLVLHNGRLLYEEVAELAEHWSKDFAGSSSYSRIGLVVGATYPEVVLKLRTMVPRCIFLMPGVGTQGGASSTVALAAGSDGVGAYGAVSRALLYCYVPSELADSDWRSRLRVAVHKTLNEESFRGLKL